MARTRNRSNQRMFVWARSGGTLETNTEGYGAVDLLQSVRDRYGAKEFAGTTVVAVRGYVRPNAPEVPFFRGRVAIRVCAEGVFTDNTGSPSRFGPGAPNFPITQSSSPEYDWMAYMPYAIGAQHAPATFNRAASPWAVDVQSARRLEELGMSLGMFHQSDSNEALIDYDLSIGLKLS